MDALDAGSPPVPATTIVPVEVGTPSSPDSGLEELERPRGTRATWWSVGILGVVPVAGVVAALVTTRHGALVGQDSAAYVGAARNLLAGRGLTTPFDLVNSTLSPAQVYAFHGAVPLVHFPPLYPVVLATFSWLGASMTGGARVLNAVVVGLSVAVFELLVRRFSRSALLVPVAGAVLFLIGPAVYGHQDLLQIQTGVLSDPLFLLVFLVTVLLVDQYLDRPGRGLLVAIAVCVAVAPLIRYVGFAAVAAAALVLWWWSPLPAGNRRRAAAAVVASGLVPSLVWTLYISRVLHGGPVRDVAWHPLGETLHFTLYIGSGWLLPASVPDGLRETIFVAIVVVAAGAVVIRRIRKPSETSVAFRHLSGLVVFAVTYLGVVAMTRTVLDASTPLDNRILLPLIPLLYLVVVSAVVNVVRPPQAGRILAAGLCLLAAAGAVGATFDMVRGGVVNDQAAVVDRSATVAAIRRLPADTIIATGVGDVVYTDTGRGSIRVPVHVEGLTHRPNPNFRAQVRQLAAILAQRHGVLVVIPEAGSDFVYRGATPRDFARVATIHLTAALPDGGQIYRISSIDGADG